MLQPSDTIPSEIKVQDKSGKEVSLKDFAGKYVVLYFYPKDFTTGCTTEALNFQSILPNLKKLKVELIGVSKDDIDSHKRFLKKNKLDITLWSDPKHELIEAFGAWGEKKLVNSIYMGTYRTTFIINPKGKIIKVWEQVKPVDHAREVLDYLNSIIKQ